MNYLTKAGVKFIKESRTGRQYPRRGRAWRRSVKQKRDKRYGQLSQTKRDIEQSVAGDDTPLARRLRAIDRTKKREEGQG